jgi:hypothetical protein
MIGLEHAVVQPVSNAIFVFWGAPDDASLWQYAQPMASLKEQRRRDFARRHWSSYRGQGLQRQRLTGL